MVKTLAKNKKKLNNKNQRNRDKYREGGLQYQLSGIANEPDDFKTSNM